VKPGGNDAKTRRATIDAYASEYTKLFQRVKDAGFFKPDGNWELLKAIYNFGSTFLGIYLIVGCNYRWWGAGFIAFGWYQQGWLGHDWSHHTWLPKSNSKWCTVNDWMAWGSTVSRGTTLLEWKLRHNTHHATTNEVGNDPDIKLAPVLYFFEDFDVNNLTKYQYMYYLPLISALHVYWLFESYLVNIKQLNSKNEVNRFWARVDMLALALHHLWVGYCMFGGEETAVLPMIAAYYASGFATAVIVFSSHYGEDRVHGMDSTVGKDKDERVSLFNEKCMSVNS
jgi:fatty acid desaturase